MLFLFYIKKNGNQQRTSPLPQPNLKQNLEVASNILFSILEHFNVTLQSSLHENITFDSHLLNEKINTEKTRT